MTDLFRDLEAPNGRMVRLNTGLFINNAFVPGSAPKIDSINPSNGEVIVQVEAASAADIDVAISAARKALNDPSWRDVAPAARGAMLAKLADLVIEHSVTLATLEAWSNGKPYSVALEEDMAEVESTLRYYAGWADKITGSSFAKAGYEQKKLAYTLRQPIGVCAQIIPWNYPLCRSTRYSPFSSSKCLIPSIAMASWKIGPAIACGNTVVLKAAEQTPVSILYFATLVEQAGFPPGVINIVNGLGSEAGKALTSHKGVDKIAFTGSTGTGKIVMRAAAENLTNVTLETGGKSPLIVFADADLEQAAKWGCMGVMSNQGQVCTATSRLIVQRSVYDKFVQLLKDEVEKTIVVGDPFAEDATQGPQVSKIQYNKVLEYIQGGKDEGAVLVTGGAPFRSENTSPSGFYIQPTIFGQVKRDMKIFQEEIFGPVAAVSVFDSLEEAIALANDSCYGLGASVFSTNVETVHLVAERLEAGMVWINSSQDSDVRVPFGGVKQSGIGRELGESVLAAYTQEKAVHVNLGLKL